MLPLGVCKALCPALTWSVVESYMVQGKNDARFYKDSLLRLKAEIKDGEAARLQEQQKLAAVQQEVRKLKEVEHSMQEKVGPYRPMIQGRGAPQQDMNDLER